MSQCTLSTSQLCDLLNFVLGLPQVMGPRTIRPAIDRFVVVSWRTKPTRRLAESWCDARLAEFGIGPKRRVRYPGRRGGVRAPEELTSWLGSGALRRTA